MAVPPCPLGWAAGAASTRASSSSSCGSSAQVAPASSTSARKTRWSPASAPVCAEAARAPATEEPTFSTATRTPRSAATASACASRAPSPSDSQKSAIERTPSSSATASSQSLASQTAWLPVDTSVCQPMPRRAFSALTATFPLWETIATGPVGMSIRASPHIGASAWMAAIPLPLGPHTGRSPRRATSVSSRSSPRPASRSPKPAEMTMAPPQPRSIASRSVSGTPAAGIATTTASTGSGRSTRRGTQGSPWTSVRFGLMPQTLPSKPAAARFRSTRSA